MKIIYCGFGRAGLECLYQLLNIVNIKIEDIVVFTHDSPENNTFIEHVNNMNITFHYTSINEHDDFLRGFNPDFLISVYYRYIIKPRVLEIVGYKAMNLHPSLLPAYRGTKSSVWAILNNEKKTGISFHYINEKIDDGNIILQDEIDISKHDTAYSLYNKLISLFVSNFRVAFNRLIDKYNGEAQCGEASYYKRELPYGGVREVSNCTFSEAQRFVRAMYFPPFKGAIFTDNDGFTIEANSIYDLEKIKHKFKVG
ncbi:hypothetical protein MHN79_09115 [Vibrio sp. Of14-4]|uniref:formyltransferase family protein n=1 Tax=Vibrio sp. Of14-4 TaxID=2724878 RepID=UPI001EF22C9E|nr:formyltransferase family protein [Vibrio sp. Of14-4]MCG7489651.1 hypothetical protein [Vibrio sp. Of14-4]